MSTVFNRVGGYPHPGLGDPAPSSADLHTRKFSRGEAILCSLFALCSMCARQRRNKKNRGPYPHHIAEAAPLSRRCPTTRRGGETVCRGFTTPTRTGGGEPLLIFISWLSRRCQYGPIPLPASLHEWCAIYCATTVPFLCRQRHFLLPTATHEKQ